MTDAKSDQKTVLVIGATRGIGAATARRFAQAGYLVAGTHRGTGAVPDGVIPIVLDIREEASIKEGFASALAALGRLDVLVVASGITKDALLLRMSEEDLLEVLRVNTVGPILAAKAALRPMLKQRAGSIVLLSSMSVKYGVIGQTNYTASKGAVEAFARSLAREHAAQGIRVNVVAPGATDTDMMAGVPEAERTAMLQSIPMGRLATPEEIAEAVLHTAESGYMSGAVVQMSGGA